MWQNGREMSQQGRHEMMRFGCTIKLLSELGKLSEILQKKEKRKLRWTKPKQGLLEKPIPRPKKPDGSDDEAESEEEEEPDNKGQCD